MLPYMAKETADGIKLKTLRWEIILDSPGGPLKITRVFIRGSEAVAGDVMVD